MILFVDGRGTLLAVYSYSSNIGTFKYPKQDARRPTISRATRTVTTPSVSTMPRRLSMDLNPLAPPFYSVQMGLNC